MLTNAIEGSFREISNGLISAVCMASLVDTFLNEMDLSSMYLSDPVSSRSSLDLWYSNVGVEVSGKKMTRSTKTKLDSHNNSHMDHRHLLMIRREDIGAEKGDSPFDNNGEA
jgi:hypothetical protein